MNYVSFAFLLYVTGCVLAYFLFPVVFRRHKEQQWAVLLVESLGFYAICSGKYLILLLLSGLSIYLGAARLGTLSAQQKAAIAGKAPRKLSREEKKSIKQQFLRKKRFVLWSVLLLNFGILAFYKYIPGVVNGLLPEGSFSLILPVGISFYTFQATGYLIDVYNGNVTAERNPFKVLLFISFFPQIIQGPIGFWDPVAGDLFACHRPEWSRMKHGFELILWGYLRKMVLADRIVNEIYLVTDSYTEHSGPVIALAVLLYAIQLYADFAGGIDISRGIAQILGICLPENFRQPYLATSINDYWRRWHITLGAWMKKYIFYPLALTPLFAGAGKRLGKTTFGKSDYGKHAARVLPAAMSCIVVFLVVGIWHGAGMRYVAFGLWNGIVIFLSMMLEPVFPAWKKALHISSGAVWYRWFQIVRTFLLVYVGYIFDVAQNFRAAMGIAGSILLCRPKSIVLLFEELTGTFTGFNTWNIAIILGVTGLMIWVDLYHERHDSHLGGDGEKLRNRIDGGCFMKEWLLVLLCAAVIVLFGIYGPGYDAVKFVYAGF